MRKVTAGHAIESEAGFCIDKGSFLLIQATAMRSKSEVGLPFSHGPISLYISQQAPTWLVRYDPTETPASLSFSVTLVTSLINILKGKPKRRASRKRTIVFQTTLVMIVKTRRLEVTKIRPRWLPFCGSAVCISDVTNKAGMRGEVSNTSRATLFCSSLVKSDPSRLHHKKLKNGSTHIEIYFFCASVS